jgi:23S rRNA pseudouridine955/2504/2580 synthase
MLPLSLCQKYIRLKRIKVNNKPAQRSYRLNEGDTLSLYVNDEFFGKPRPENAYLSILNPDLDIVYEDEQILLVDKRPGVLVHPDDQNNEKNTLIARIQAYLYLKGEWNPSGEHSFAPALCNRIDRNTGGIVIAAKTAAALRIINQKIKNREIDKYYICIVHGKPSPPCGTLSGFLFKDAKKNRVYVRNKSEKGSKTAVTEYRLLAERNGLSLLECRLITGRTHQIRAQLAAFGHPLLGDGKYGTEKDAERYQALYSYKLIFSFSDSGNELGYLNGRTFTVRKIDFVGNILFRLNCIDI